MNRWQNRRRNPTEDVYLSQGVLGIVKSFLPDSLTVFHLSSSDSETDGLESASTGSDKRDDCEGADAQVMLADAHVVVSSVIWTLAVLKVTLLPIASHFSQPPLHSPLIIRSIPKAHL